MRWGDFYSGRCHRKIFNRAEAWMMMLQHACPAHPDDIDLSGMQGG
jgi:hypothetical protein